MVASKVLASIVLHRQTAQTKKQTRTQRAAFFLGRNCVDQLFTFRRLLQHRRTHLSFWFIWEDHPVGLPLETDYLKSTYEPSNPSTVILWMSESLRQAFAYLGCHRWSLTSVPFRRFSNFATNFILQWLIAGFVDGDGEFLPRHEIISNIQTAKLLLNRLIIVMTR